MRRTALLIGAPFAGRANELRGVPNDIELMAGVLASYGFDCVRCAGSSATRAGILECMEHLIADTRDDDAVVVYYTGHGGMVINTEHIPDLETDGYNPPYHQYLVPEDFHESGDRDFRGILDIELGWLLARLTERTRNVTVMLDCCFSGGLVRGRILKAIDTKAFGPRETKYNRWIAQRLDELAERRARESWPALDPDANPVAVRIEAARSDEGAREGAYQGIVGGRQHGLLTAAWVHAVEQYRGQPVTWDVVHDRVCTLVSRYSDDAQHPGLGGPRHRLLFQLEESAVPGAIGITRHGPHFYLRGGALLGIQAGDRFRLVPAAGSTTGADLGRATAIEVMPDTTRLDVACIEGDEDAMDGARAVLLRRGGHCSAVDVQVVGPARAELLQFMEEAGSLVPYSGDGELLARVDQVSGVAGDPLVEIRDARGCTITAPLPPGPPVITALERLQRAALVRRLESGRGAHALGAPFEICWRLASGASSAHVRHQGEGRLEGMSEGPPEVSEGDALIYEISNLAPARKGNPAPLYLTIFDVDVDGNVILRTRAESSGVCIPAQDKHTPGYRAHGGFTPLRMDWPREMPRIMSGLRSLVFILADRPHDLRALETCDIDAHSPTRSLVLPDIAMASTGNITRATPDSGRPAAGMRYAVVHVNFMVRPKA